MNTNTCKAGFHQTDITPDFPVELIGCYRKDPTSHGILHRLYAQALVLNCKEQCYCLIAIDSLGLTTTLSDVLRLQIANVLNTETSHIMLNFSHTHSAPAPLSPLNGEKYFQLLCNQVLGCVATAEKEMQPCLAGWDVTTTEVAENRREGCTQVDTRLGALQIVNANTLRTIALIVRLSVHSNILMGEHNAISSDLFGVARMGIEKRFDCPVMLIQGSAGNLKPVGVDTITGGEIEDLQRCADIIIQSMQQLQFSPKIIEHLYAEEKELEFISEVPTAEYAKSLASEAKQLFNIDGEAWIAECKRLRDEEKCTEQRQKRSIQFLSIDEGCFCGVSDELFCEIALDASQKVGSNLFFLNGYTNGCAGYLPHRAEYLKGGYETLYSYLSFFQFHGHVMPFKLDTAEHIVELVVQTWKNEQPSQVH